MCGNIGIFGKSITNTTREIFLQMLDTGKVRGTDATGMAAIFSDKTVKVVKDNVDGSKFVDLNEHKLARAMEGSLQALLGHNRFKTMGANTVANAHPFSHSPVVGIHNGVIDVSSLKNLPTPSSYAVDSEQLIHSIAASGVDGSIAAVSGDWALIWYNSDDDRIYFLRNSGRPLWYRYGKDHKLMYVLSEPAMGNWLINRLSDLDDDGWHPFKPNMLYSLDANQWTMELKEEREVKGKEYEYVPSPSRPNWWEVSGQVSNVRPFKPRPKAPNVLTMRFSTIEDTPIFSLDELREMDASTTATLYERAIRSRDILKTSMALDYIDLSQNNWSGKLTWRPSHQAQVLANIRGLAAQMEKLETINLYIKILEGRKIWHDVVKNTPKPVAEVKVGAAIEYDVKEPDTEDITVHTLTVLPTKNILDFDKEVETAPIDHLTSFLGTDSEINPSHDLAGTIVLDWTKGMNTDDVDHVETCKGIYRWLEFLVQPGLKHNFPSKRRDDYIDNFDKAVTIRSYGMDWKAPSSMWTTQSKTRKCVFALCKQAVERGLKRMYLSPFVYQEKLLEIKPYLKEDVSCLAA